MSNRRFIAAFVLVIVITVGAFGLGTWALIEESHHVNDAHREGARATILLGRAMCDVLAAAESADLRHTAGRAAREDIRRDYDLLRVPVTAALATVDGGTCKRIIER